MVKVNLEWHKFNFSILSLVKEDHWTGGFMKSTLAIESDKSEESKCHLSWILFLINKVS